MEIKAYEVLKGNILWRLAATTPEGVEYIKNYGEIRAEINPLQTPVQYLRKSDLGNVAFTSYSMVGAPHVMSNEKLL